MKPKHLRYLLFVGWAALLTLPYLLRHKAPPPGYCVLEDDAGHFFIRDGHGIIQGASCFRESSLRKGIQEAWWIKSLEDSLDKKGWGPGHNEVTTNVVGDLHEISCTDSEPK